MGSSKTCTKLYELELEILERGDAMTSEEARSLHQSVLSCYKDFVKHQPANLKHYPTLKEMKMLNSAADFVQKKTIRLEERLRKIISSADSTTVSESETKSKVGQQLTDTLHLTSLHREQKLYIRMIESLESTDDLDPKEAKIQYDYLDQFYEKFIANQCELAPLMEEASFNDQIEISKQVLHKVVKIQAKLQNIFSPQAKPAAPVSKSIVDDHFNQTERPRVITDFLESQFKKQKSLIEQIEWIESKINPDPVEAETLHDHLSHLHDLFVKNQARIETYVSDSILDDQLKISREILQKVVSLRTKLKRIFAPISQTSDVSKDTAIVELSDVDCEFAKKELELWQPNARNSMKDSKYLMSLNSELLKRSNAISKRLGINRETRQKEMLSKIENSSVVTTDPLSESSVDSESDDD